jgi:predicted DNA-binding protein (UPF0251 family)
MPEDQFKQFVDTHREAFESSSQDFQQIWSEIEQGLDSKSSLWHPGWMKVAAALLILLVSGWVAFVMQTRDQLPLELQESEQHYFSLIQVKMEQLSPHQNSVDALIWEDLEMLDHEYEALKLDLKERIDQEEVAQAMIENQRLKLEILEQILHEIESKAKAEDVNNVEI